MRSEEYKEVMGLLTYEVANLLVFDSWIYPKVNVLDIRASSVTEDQLVTYLNGTAFAARDLNAVKFGESPRGGLRLIVAWSEKRQDRTIFLSRPTFELAVDKFKLPLQYVEVLLESQCTMAHVPPNWNFIRDPRSQITPQLPPSSFVFATPFESKPSCTMAATFDNQQQLTTVYLQCSSSDGTVLLTMINEVKNYLIAAVEQSKSYFFGLPAMAITLYGTRAVVSEGVQLNSMMSQIEEAMGFGDVSAPDINQEITVEQRAKIIQRLTGARLGIVRCERESQALLTQSDEMCKFQERWKGWDHDFVNHQLRYICAKQSDMLITFRALQNRCKILLKFLDEYNPDEKPSDELIRQLINRLAERSMDRPAARPVARIMDRTTDETVDQMMDHTEDQALEEPRHT